MKNKHPSDSPTSIKVFVAGASVRAAMQSVIASGNEPCGADMFADRDATAAGFVQPVTNYPRGIESMLNQLELQDVDGWMFTGALENHPSLLERLCARTNHLGSSVESIRNVRNPDTLFSTLADAGISAPTTSRQLQDLMKVDRVLKKPLQSAAGANIRFVSNSDRATRNHRSNYFQEWIDGEPCSGVFVGHQGEADLVGVTRQLIGCEWCNSSRFQYCGSMGALPLNDEQHSAWRRIGSLLATKFDVEGIFGVDAIVNDRGVFPVEVNPRYTASVEVLERSLKVAALRSHFDLFQNAGQMRVHKWQHVGEPKTFCGKAILYAASDLRISRRQSDTWLDQATDEFRTLADIPHEGIIKQGWPIMTVFAEHREYKATLSELKRRAQHVLSQLGGGI